MVRIKLVSVVTLLCRHVAGTSSINSDDHYNRIELLNTVLVASVDGHFHAVDRATGQLQWSMPTVISPKHSPSGPTITPLVCSRSAMVGREDVDLDSDTYVIEPQTGDIFVLPPRPLHNKLLHKLGISVEDLVEHSPFQMVASEESSRTFVGKRQISRLKIDLLTGRILSSVDVKEDCKWGDKLFYCDLDDNRRNRTRGRNPTVSIDRTDYYVTVVAGGTKIQQLSYSRYGPSNIDSSPQIRWYKTPDAIYVQSHPRGHLWAFSTNRSEVVDWLLPQFEHPIVAIFDVIAIKGHADPIALLQPRPHIAELIGIGDNQADLIYTKLADRTYVGQIQNTLYAMSAKNYPLVAFDMQDRHARSANDDDEADSWYEECTKVECMVGRWRTLDVPATTGRGGRGSKAQLSPLRR